MNRRSFLLSGAAVAAGATRAWAGGPERGRGHNHAAGHVQAQDTTAQSGTPSQDAGRLFNPNVVQQRARSTDFDNDEYIKGIEKQLGCTCGCNLDIYTCRTTDFTCTTSPQLHREVVALHQSGLSAEEILEEFMARYGDDVLMAPKPEGFNLAGYLVPGILVTLVATALTILLIRRQRAMEVVAVADAQMMADPSAPPPAVDATPEELERLQQALRDADG